MVCQRQPLDSFLVGQERNFFEVVVVCYKDEIMNVSRKWFSGVFSPTIAKYLGNIQMFIF